MSKIVYKKYSIDSKSLSTLFLVLFWLILGFIICFIGIKNTYASTYTPDNFTAQLFDNINGSLSYQQTNNEIVDNKNIYYYGFINNLVANSAGGAWGISSPIPLINNHTYSMTVKTQVVGCGTTQLSSINRIGIGPDMGFAKYAYENNQYAEELYSKTLNSNLLQFVFKARTDSSYIIFPFSTSISCSNKEVFLYDISIEDLGSDGITQDEINSSLNNQTNTINNSIQNSTDTIINNQNQNNEELKDTINDNFNSCRDSYNLFNANLIPSSTGIIVSDNGKTITMPLKTSGGGYTGTSKTLKELAPNLKVGDVVWLNFKRNLGYLHNNLIYLQEASSSWTNGSSRTITQNDLDSIVVLYANSYDSGETEQVILSDFIISYNNVPFEKYGEICSNKIDETNDKLNDLNNSLNNSNTNGATNDASNFFSNFTTDTFGLTSIITAPLSLINTITSSSCSPLRLPLPYLENEYLELPCMNTIYTRYFGSFFSIYQTITFGVVAYWVIVRIFNQVKDFKNPDHDEIEVLDL